MSFTNFNFDETNQDITFFNKDISLRLVGSSDTQVYLKLKSYNLRVMTLSQVGYKFKPKELEILDEKLNNLMPNLKNIDTALDMLSEYSELFEQIGENYSLYY